MASLRVEGQPEREGGDYQASEKRVVYENNFETERKREERTNNKRILLVLIITSQYWIRCVRVRE